jgi:hypothetical protein
MKTLKMSLFIVCLLAFSRLDAFAQNPYSRTFPLKVGKITVGELVVSFENVIKVGDFWVTLSSTSPSSSVFPRNVTPYTLPQINSPLFIKIETTSSFRGPATVFLRTVLLDYNSQVPLRLFAAEGTYRSAFRDITASTGKGSMYTNGYRAGFSEFVIALDKRPGQFVTDLKVFELNQALEAHRSVIDPDRYKILRGLLDKLIQTVLRLTASVLALLGDVLKINLLNQALTELNQFIVAVREGASLGEIPDTFNDPTNPDGNVAGDLFSRAQTAAFSVKISQ